MPHAEIPFFEDPDYQQHGIESLGKLMKPGHDKKRVGIKRPGYLPKAECPARIHQHIPDAKLIVVLRDPIDRAVSGYYHQATYGFAPLKHINQGLPEIIDGHHDARYPKAWQIVQFGFYHEHLTRYLRYFSWDQIFITTYRELKHDAHDTLRAIFTFLGVDPDYVPAAMSKSVNVTTYTVPRLRFLQLRNHLRYTYNADRTRRYPRQNRSLMNKALLRSVMTFDQHVMARLFGNDKPQLSPELERRLAALYCQDATELAHLTGFDLSHWRVFKQDT